MYVVGLPGVSPDVEEGKESHFNIDQEGGDADRDIGLEDLVGGFDGAGGVEEGKNYLVGGVRW